VFAHKYLTGYGHERGGVTVNIFNNMNETQEIDYFDSVPWFLKLYLHTLKVSVLGQEQVTQTGELEAYAQVDSRVHTE
jgi:phosphatidylinositol glycan class T